LRINGEFFDDIIKLFFFSGCINPETDNRVKLESLFLYYHKAGMDIFPLRALFFYLVYNQPLRNRLKKLYKINC